MTSAQEMTLFQNIAIGIYIVGLILWLFVWRGLVGFEWLKKETLMYLPFLIGALVLLI